MRRILWVLVFTFTSAISLLAHADTAKEIQLPMVWTNQRGSTLIIREIGSNGQLTGTYINGAQGTGCQGTPYLVTGWLYDKVISFAVIWQNNVASCNSITAWTGFIGNNLMKTKWQLVTNGSLKIDQGEDDFKSIPYKIHKSFNLEQQESNSALK